MTLGFVWILYNDHASWGSLRCLDLLHQMQVPLPHLNWMNLHTVSIRSSPPWNLPAPYSKHGKHIDRVACCPVSYLTETLASWTWKLIPLASNSFVPVLWMPVCYASLFHFSNLGRHIGFLRSLHPPFLPSYSGNLGPSIHTGLLLPLGNSSSWLGSEVYIQSLAPLPMPQLLATSLAWYSLKKIAASHNNTATQTGCSVSDPNLRGPTENAASSIAMDSKEFSTFSSHLIVSLFIPLPSLYNQKLLQDWIYIDPVPGLF